MDSQIKKLIAKMDELNDKLRAEYTRLSNEYGFSVRKRAVVFLEQFKEKNKEWRIPAWKYVIPRNFRHALSIPFIYILIFPVVVLDFFMTLYNWVVFPLYRIPIVKRKDHIIYDRQFLDYLNIIQKANCLYCSYVNGIFSYMSEIGARTERYWCPVKAARKPKYYHEWYKDFADYGSPEEWEEKFNDATCFDGDSRD